MNASLLNSGISFILLLLFLAVLTISANVPHSLFFRPQGVHQWRQCDCTSQALNFHQNRVSFFTPQMHTQTGENGFAASEFPLIYYLVARLYDVFGFHESLFRGFNLLLFYTALFFLYALGRRYFRDPLLAFIPVVFLGTLPAVFYYANNFLPNVPAISLALAGWYFFMRHLETGRMNAFVTAFVFFTLSALIKVSDGISLVAALAFYVLLWLRRLGYSTWTPWKHSGWKLLTMLLSLTAVVCWNLYARYFNEKNHTGQNLLGILPYWDMSAGDLERTKERFLIDWKWQVIPAYSWLLLKAMLVSLVVFWNLHHRYLRVITALLATGSFCYVILWYQAMEHHDYYMLTPVMAATFLVITHTETLARMLRKFRPVPVRMAVIPLLCFSTWYLLKYNANVQEYRYTSPVFKYVNPSMYSIEPWLRSQGVDRKDWVVSVPDPSPNITLYLMNNPGFTEAFNTDSYNINYFAYHGAKFLVISDSAYLRHPLYAPYLAQPVGENGGVYLFRLPP